MKIINCFFDGACEFPGGAMGSGWIIKENSKTIKEGWMHNEAEADNTSNVAEYLGLRQVFSTLHELGLQNEEIRVFGDSQLVINQMNNQWRISNGNYVNQALKAKEEGKKFKNIIYTWIPREQNKRADELSKKGLNNEPMIDAAFEEPVKKTGDKWDRLNQAFDEAINKMTDEEWEAWGARAFKKREEAVAARRMKGWKETPTFKKLEAQLNMNKNELVLDPTDFKVYRLVGIDADEHDYYWVLDTGRKEVWSSCVGGWIPLKDRLEKQEYDRMVSVWNYNTEEKAI